MHDGQPANSLDFEGHEARKWHKMNPETEPLVAMKYQSTSIQLGREQRLSYTRRQGV